MAIGVALQAFFKALFDPAAAERIKLALNPESAQAKLPEKPKSAPAKQAPQPIRSEALTLLSTLQREARFLDLVQESLDGFEDAQIGAAARGVLADCHKTLDRMFAIAPLSAAEEGDTLAVPEGASPNAFRIVGSSGSSGTGVSGTVTHRGWKATCCELPKWNGKRDEAWVLAATEVEVGT